MTMKPIALFCSLILLEWTLAEPCVNKTYNFLFTPGCEVSEVLPIGFAATNYTQTEPCSPTNTVCVSVPLPLVEFSGKFPSTNPKILAITISGEGKTAELPIVYTPIKLATPMVAEFPVGGMLTFAQKQSFKFDAIQGATVSADNNIMSATEDSCTGDKVCYQLTPATGPITGIDIWGKIGTVLSITINTPGASGAAATPTVEIPLILLAATSVSPDPLALNLAPSTQQKAISVTVPFVVKTVSDGLTPPKLKEKLVCQSTDPCYAIFNPTSATFEGKMPTSPVTITISDASHKNTYIFGSAGTTLKSGLLTFMTALFAARI